MLYLLDYGAGNVASLANSVRSLGFDFKWIETVADFDKADRIIFPGVGAFGSALTSLRDKGFAEPLRQYIASGRPYFGICIGMQALFASSDESAVPGLGVVPGHVGKFSTTDKAVPCMGWNGATTLYDTASRVGIQDDASYYFVHSYRVKYEPAVEDWALTLTRYGDETYVSSIHKGNVTATQFHPEKSGAAGLAVLQAWLAQVVDPVNPPRKSIAAREAALTANGFAKRVVACLDVRANDAGDLVVTKGDQYDVREVAVNTTTPAPRDVRNLGKPVELARRYFAEGADEIAFLNITSFRACPLHDQPMLDVVRQAAETVFVPLTIGGGIRDTIDPDGTPRSALEVAGTYFRCGADKVSIGSDAVYAVEELIAAGGVPGGRTGIEMISVAYGNQAVVVSIDPRRVYATTLADIPAAHRAHAVDLASPHLARNPAWALRPDLGPLGERFCWYQCTVQGGRESRDLDVVQLAQGVEKLGAGEILLNSVDRDGSKAGFDLRLVALVRDAVTIPVIASSGAGKVEDFVDVFAATGVEAALAAGIFHRKEVPLQEVKTYMAGQGIPVRREL